MNPRKLAQKIEARLREIFYGSHPLSKDDLPRITEELGWHALDTQQLIAITRLQADLLEKYRKEHRPDVLACADNRNHGGSDWRCELCRAYDKLTEEQS